VKVHKRPFINVLLLTSWLGTIENHDKNGKNHGRRLQKSRKLRQFTHQNVSVENAVFLFFSYACHEP